MAKKNKDHKDVNWYEDKYQSIVVWRNWLFVITSMCLIGIIIMAFILLNIMPLKSVKPYVIQIDETSGRVKVVESKKAKQITEDEAVIMYFVRNYIEAREGYDPNTFKTDYYSIVNSMSVEDVYKEFKDSLKTSRNSPLLTIASSGYRTAEVTDLELINENPNNGDTTWRVFFNIADKARNNRARIYKNRAIMHINFADQVQMGAARAKYNPLSMIVKRYRVDYNLGG